VHLPPINPQDGQDHYIVGIAGFRDWVHKAKAKNTRVNENDYLVAIFELYKLFKDLYPQKNNKDFIADIIAIDKTFSERKFYKVKKVGNMLVSFPLLKAVDISTNNMCSMMSNIEKLFISKQSEQKFLSMWRLEPIQYFSTQ
jgi:hypothetical protein